MRKVSEKIRLEDGSIKRRQKDMRRLLNLNYLTLTNKTISVGEYDLPALYCSTDIVPDYLALYNQPGNYHRTALTGVCFYIYDNTFDGMQGLFNAFITMMMNCYLITGNDSEMSGSFFLPIIHNLEIYRELRI